VGFWEGKCGFCCVAVGVVGGLWVGWFLCGELVGVFFFFFCSTWFGGLLGGWDL